MSFFRRRMMIESGYSITFNLDGLTAVAPSSVKPLLSCNISFIEDSGKLLLPSTVVVRMGGTDITKDVYNFETNQIEIPSVTNNVAITAIAETIPSAYKPVLYLRNTDVTANVTSKKFRVFNTGHYPTNLTEVELDGIIGTNTYGGLFGVFKGSSQFFMLHRRYNGTVYMHAVWGNGVVSNSSHGTTVTQYAPQENKRITIKMGKGHIIYPDRYGEERDIQPNSTLETPWTSTYELTFGGEQVSENVYRGAWMMIYGFKVSENNVLIRRYIPCVRIADNFTGFYDLVNETFLTEKTTSNTERADWIPPLVFVTNTLTNSTASLQTPLLTSGTTAMAVIGGTWTIKITPTVNYTFRDPSSVLHVLVNGDNISNNVATYDYATDSWEVTLNPHWKDTISITATAESYMLYTDIDGLELTNSLQPVLNSSWSSGFSNTNGKQLYPDSIVVKMGGVDITSTAFNIATNQVEIDNVTGAIDITAKSVEVSSSYEPMLYISTRNKDHGNAISFPYYPTSNTKLELDIDLILLTYAILFAIKNPNTAPSATAPQFAFWVRITSSSNYSLSWGSKTTSTTSTAAGRLRTGARTLFTCDRGKFTYTNQANGTRTLTLNGGVWTNTSNRLKIMAYSNSTSTTQGGYASNGKVYRATISDYNESNDDYDLTLDYIPVKRVSDDEVGLYDLVNGDFIENPGNYILPYVNPTLNLTNCTGTLLSAKDTGITNHIVYEKEWSCKYTPSSGTFESFLVLINDEDVTSEVATYDATTDSWTVTLTAHWGDTIDITANAQ